jgi:hypothetical protein
MMNFTQRLVASIAGVLVASTLLLLPTRASAAPSHAPLSSAKSVSLQLGDVHRVVDRSLTVGPARYSTPHAMGACTSTPPKTDFTANFESAVGTKGVLAVISQVVTYGSSAGPTCNQKLVMSQARTLGKTLGIMTTAHGVGTQAFLLDTTGPKTSAPAVYTLGLDFTRGIYRALIIVQSNKKISGSTLIRLGKIVDNRMKAGH